MLVYPVSYNMAAPGTPFVPPPMPGVLVINPGDAQYQITMARTQYNMALKEHQMYILLQHVLILLLQKSVDSKYTHAVHNHVTGQLPGDIKILRDHLLSTYGKVLEHELYGKYDITTKLTYNMSDPINKIFNLVEDLCEAAKLGNYPYSPIQQVNIGYQIVSKRRIFWTDVQNWMRKYVGDKIWANFVAHLHQAHRELRDAYATIGKLGYQSANAFVAQIVHKFRKETEE